MVIDVFIIVEMNRLVRQIGSVSCVFKTFPSQNPMWGEGYTAREDTQRSRHQFDFGGSESSACRCGWCLLSSIVSNPEKT